MAFVRRMCPNPGEAISLQFQLHRNAFRRRRILFLVLMCLLLDADQLLNVVSDFVCQHVSLGKLSRRSESALQLIVKTKIDIHLFVGWTIERSGSRLRHSTGGVDRIAKQNELSVAVGDALGGK